MQLSSGPEPIAIGDDQRAQSLWKLQREAADIKFFVDVPNSCEHAMFQLHRCLPPRCARTGILFLSAQPGNRCLVEEHIAYLTRLRAGALLRIRAGPGLEAALTACRLIVAGDGTPLAMEEARATV